MKRRRKNSELLLMSGNPARRRNPAELVMMAANPARPAGGPTKLDLQRQARERAEKIRQARENTPKPRKNPHYDRLSVDERLAFGRLGLGKAQLQSASDIRRARKKLADVQRFRNRLPNPGGSATADRLPSLDAPQATHARDLREAFTEHSSDRYTVATEPHIPAGDYALLGQLVELRCKPEAGGQVQIITPEGKVLVISNASGRQIYFVGEGQALGESEVRIFTDSGSDRVELGECRSIVYEAAKWHEAVDASARGKKVEWEHKFGEDGGYPPKLFYLRSRERLALEGGSYHVEGAGIVN
jgi:hypothetical protein